MALPITSIVSAVFALILIPLSMRVGIERYRNKIWLLDGGHQELTRRIRVHGNFVEYVPFSLLMIALVELAGGSSMLVWGLGAGLIVSRLLHAIGLSLSETSLARGLGANGTFLVLAVSAVWLLYHSV